LQRDILTVMIPARNAIDRYLVLRAMRGLHRPQSSSASRFTAGASGFLNLSQSCERPDL
jgi:hypothetical protein